MHIQAVKLQPALFLLRIRLTLRFHQHKAAAVAKLFSAVWCCQVFVVYPVRHYRTVCHKLEGSGSSVLTASGFSAEKGLETSLIWIRRATGHSRPAAMSRELPVDKPHDIVQCAKFFTVSISDGVTLAVGPGYPLNGASSPAPVPTLSPVHPPSGKALGRTDRPGLVLRTDLLSGYHLIECMA